MQAKSVLLLGIFCCLQIASSDECSWSDEERALNCCNRDLNDDGVPKEVLEKCGAELGLKPEEGPVDRYDPCAEECIWREEGLLGEDGKAKIDILKGPTDLAKEKCTAEYEAYAVPEGKCKSNAHLVAHCNDVYAYMHCSNWKDTAECNATREKLTKCYDTLLMPPHAVAMSQPA